MKIDYCISTMVFWWREHHLSFEQECDYIKSLGFGVEIWPTIRGHSECRFNKRNWHRLKDATEDMTVVLHGRVDGPTLKDWEEQILCAKMLGAPLTTHLESLCISDTLDIADWDFAKEVVKLAKDNEVDLNVETGRLNAILEVGEKFDSVGFCFNTGHAYLDPETDFNEYVDKLGSRIRHIHLTDNYGNRDDHQPPGLGGGIPDKYWKSLLDELEKHNNHIIGGIEMHPPMPGVMIKRAEKFLFEHMKWPTPPKKAEDYQERHYRPF
jgi:sugar phosphate isomerase/epimerase